jgi:hypothetical protein
MTPHTGNGVITVPGVAGTAEVYLSAGCVNAAVTVVTVAANIRIIRVGVVETGFPVNALGIRVVVAVTPEAGVALAALSHAVRIVRVVLVRRRIAGPEGYRQGGQRPDHGKTAK